MEKRVNRRRNYFIEKGFQTRFILKFCLLVILGTLVTGVLLYLLSMGSTTVTFENLRATVKTTADFLFPILIQTIIVSTIVVGIATIILTLFISHKIAGPLYRFKKGLKSVSQGDFTNDFRIRKNDQLQDIALSMNEMINKLREVFNDLKAHYSTLRNSWDRLISSSISEDKKIGEEVGRIIEELSYKLGYFKT